MDKPQVVKEKLDLKKNPYSAKIKSMRKPDEKLLKLKPVVKIRKLNLEKNLCYKKQQNEEQKKKPVDIKKLLLLEVKLENINSKSLYKKFPKLTVRKL